MKMKHTKGEWYAKDGQIYPQETGKTLAVIPYYDAENEEQKANAQLIAAAPDLLEIAVRMFGYLQTFEYTRLSDAEEDLYDRLQAILYPLTDKNENDEN